MKKVSLAVVLATHNEAENIGRCLQAVKDIGDEIIIVDGESTDKTVEIAKCYGAMVKQTTNKAMFHTNKQMAIDLAKSDWVLQLDADEIITPGLAQEIVTTINSHPQANAYWIKRKNYFLGRFLTKGGVYPDPVIRLFKHGKAHLPQKDVHEQMAVEGEVGTLSEPMEHYTAPTFSRYLTNANRYTSFTANQWAAANLPINLINTLKYLLIKPFYTLINMFILHKGFYDGFPGFVFALFSGLHFPLAYMKYWEHKHSSYENHS
jgi:glycosyltransferase involved in cell wall biosynthesis